MDKGDKSIYHYTYYRHGTPLVGQKHYVYITIGKILCTHKIVYEPRSGFRTPPRRKRERDYESKTRDFGFHFILDATLDGALTAAYSPLDSSFLLPVLSHPSSSGCELQVQNQSPAGDPVSRFSRGKGTTNLETSGNIIAIQLFVLVFIIFIFLVI